MITTILLIFWGLVVYAVIGTLLAVVCKKCGDPFVDIDGSLSESGFFACVWWPFGFAFLLSVWLYRVLTEK